MNTASNPQKIAGEFDSSAGLAIIFALIIVGACIWNSMLVVPSVLSASLGIILAGVTVSLTKRHRYRGALKVIRGKVALAVIGGVVLYLISRDPIQASAFTFGVYAGFWVSMLALKRMVVEQLTFIGIGADLEKTEVQDIFK